MLSDQDPPSLRDPILGMRPALKPFCPWTSSLQVVSDTNQPGKAVYKQDIPIGVAVAGCGQALVPRLHKNDVRSIAWSLYTIPWQLGPGELLDEVPHPSFIHSLAFDDSAT